VAGKLAALCPRCSVLARLSTVHTTIVLIRGSKSPSHVRCQTSCAVLVVQNQHWQVGVRDHTLCATLQVMADHRRHLVVLARAAEATKFHEQDCAWLSGASAKMSSLLEDLVNRRADVLLQCGFINGTPFVLPAERLCIWQEFKRQMGAAVDLMQIEHQQWLERRDAEYKRLLLKYWVCQGGAEEQPCTSNSTSPTHSGPDAVRQSGSPVVLACLTMLK
jgi:hypothetical protein